MYMEYNSLCVESTNTKIFRFRQMDFKCILRFLCELNMVQRSTWKWLHIILWLYIYDTVIEMAIHCTVHKFSFKQSTRTPSLRCHQFGVVKMFTHIHVSLCAFVSVSVSMRLCVCVWLRSLDAFETRYEYE